MMITVIFFVLIGKEGQQHDSFGNLSRGISKSTKLTHRATESLCHPISHFPFPSVTQCPKNSEKAPYSSDKLFTPTNLGFCRIILELHFYEWQRRGNPMRRVQMRWIEPCTLPSAALPTPSPSFTPRPCTTSASPFRPVNARGWSVTYDVYYL